MKRISRARCAAANESDDEDDWAGVFVSRKIRRTGGDGAASNTAAKPPPSSGSKEEGGAAVDPEGGEKRKAKVKEFAWMDSDDDVGDEGDGASGAGGDGEPSSVTKGAGDGKESKQEADDDDEENVVVSVETIDEVQSFGRMVLLAPALRKRLRSGEQEAPIVAAACRALARTRFFDGELLEDLQSAVLQLLKAERLEVTQASDALLCLRELNAYDQRVLSAVAVAFSGKTATLEPAVRSVWHDVFISMGHSQDKDFLQLLEVPPLLPTSPAFKRIRCRFLDRGGCALGVACTYSHDDRAPISLEQLSSAIRSSPVVMTQTQYSMGRGCYGNKSPLPGLAPPLPGMPRP